MGTLTFRAIEFRRNSHWSVGNDYTLLFSETGNLQLRSMASPTPLWETATTGERFVVQEDGNLVIYDLQGEPVWASDTAGHPDAVLVAGDNGSLEVVSADGVVLWKASTESRKLDQTEFSAEADVRSADLPEGKSDNPDTSTD